MAASDNRPPVGASRTRRRRIARDSAALAVGSVIAGLLAYAFFALATRTLGAHDAAPISVLWTYWSIAAAILTFTIQHWTIATMTRDGHEGTVARSLPRLSLGALALSVISASLAFVFRDSLFNDSGLTFPILIAVTTIGSFFLGFQRGVLSGRQRFAATAASLVLENLTRVVGAFVVAAADGGATAFGFVMVAGPLTGLIWIRSLRLDRGPIDTSAMSNPFALASGTAVGSLLAQLVLTSAPVVLAVVGGAPADVTSLFVALAVWRAPYIVALGVAPQATTLMSRFVARGQRRRVAQVHALIAIFVLAGSAIAVLIGLTILEPVLQLAFGSGIEMDQWLLAELGIGTSLALGNLLLMLLLLAQRRSGLTSAAWGIAIVASTAWLAFSGQEVLPRVVAAFLAAQATAFMVLFLASWRSHLFSSAQAPS